ncbi:MAG: hypothetical protein AAFR91_11530 [Pseudomonadota bacterium]
MKRLLDTQVRALRPKKHKYRKSDGDSLYLAIHTTGCKNFELRVIGDAGKSNHEKRADIEAKIQNNKAALSEAELQLTPKRIAEYTAEL